MVSVRKRRIGKKDYYYIEHSYKVGRKVKRMSRYLGTKEPEDIGKIKKEIEFEAIRKGLGEVLTDIKKKYLKEVRSLPKTAKSKREEAFMVSYIYNSDRIEGSRLSYKDTADLFVHGTAPANKPIKDIKEAEGHRKAFYDMIECKRLSLDIILKWHRMIFESSSPEIAGKIRKHKITVTGCRYSFPHPEELKRLLSGFFSWCEKNCDSYNPVEFAALVHLRFVTIHPFTDGNGRVGRLIANHILNRNRYPLLNIRVVDRKSYYHNLEKSQLWNDEIPFLRFFIKKYQEPQARDG